ncbi:MAG: radical SAM protein [Armatimonadetes bacterium]|nr:radical SAM protein [Armatimonadota bacterium]
MSVLLVHPPQVGEVGLQELAFVEPLAVERLAATVPEAAPRILDMRLDADLERALREARPRVVGIACPFTTQVPEVLRLAERVKREAPEAAVVVGGHHPTLMPQDFASPSVDAIVAGEGERTFADLVAYAMDGASLDGVPGLILNSSDGQRRTAPRTPIQDLDSLPLPARHLTADWRRRYFWMNQIPHALVETARGCPYRCTFCSVWRFYGTAVRYQSPERIVEEVASVEEPYVLFTDDNFLLSVNRAREAGELLARRGIRKQYTFQARTDTIARHPDLIEQWRDLGLVCVFLGLEKVSEGALDDLDKRNTVENNEAAIALLKRLGVGFTGNFIADPQWDHAQFAELRDYVTERQLFNSSFSVLTPLPGTVLYEENKGRITTDDYELFDLWHTVLPTRLPLEEFYREFAGLWQAAAASTPQANRRRRLLKGLWQVLTGKVNLAHARRLTAGLKQLRDPEAYLRAHP